MAMCGRYESIGYSTAMDLLDNDPDEIAKLKYSDKSATYEVFPTNSGIVQTNSGYMVMQWGIPKWDHKGHIINGRQETLLEKPFYRKDFTLHRCIILASAFYEWTDSTGRKEKNIITENNQDIIKFAGLYKITDGIPHYVIITQQATPAFEVVHDRLPLMLDDDQISDYLAGAKLEQWTKPKMDVQLSWHSIAK
ncbi:SOS response-associated peptidase [Culicoidibacter larvae]|nr:SOS response-associated peptidase family protein [Culicoidibacter larvae]